MSVLQTPCVIGQSMACLEAALLVSSRRLSRLTTRYSESLLNETARAFCTCKGVAAELILEDDAKRMGADARALLALRSRRPVAPRTERDNAIYCGPVCKQRSVALIGNCDEIEVGPPRLHVLNRLNRQ